jgi:hypothetical protein
MMNQASYDFNEFKQRLNSQPEPPMSTPSDGLSESRKRWQAELKSLSLADLCDRLTGYRDMPETQRDIQERLKEVANDLLAACEASLELIDVVDGSGITMLNHSPYKEKFDSIKAAIARAEGRS